MNTDKKLERSNLQAFCRTCLQRLESATATAPKYSIRETPYLMKLLMLCTAININEEADDVYPQLLCSKCYNTLQEFQLFREMALQSNEMLKELVESEDGEFITSQACTTLRKKFTIDAKPEMPTEEISIDAFKAEEPEMTTSFCIYDVNEADDSQSISAVDESTELDGSNGGDTMSEKASTSASAMKRKRKAESNDTEMQTQKRKRIWQRAEDELFISLWAEKKADLRSGRKNSHIYVEMAAALSGKGLIVTAEQVRYKILNLTKKYRIENQGASGGSPSEWPYYNAVHEIISAQRINNTENDALDILCASSNPPSSRLSPTLFSPLSSLPSPLNSSSPPGPSSSGRPARKPMDNKLNICNQVSKNMEEHLLHSLEAEKEKLAELKRIRETNTEPMNNKLNKCNQMSKNMEEHLLHSLEVEKEKLAELKRIRETNTELSNGILQYLRNSSNNNI